MNFLFEGREGVFLLRQGKEAHEKDSLLSGTKKVIEENKEDFELLSVIQKGTLGGRGGFSCVYSCVNACGTKEIASPRGEIFPNAQDEVKVVGDEYVLSKNAKKRQTGKKVAG